MKVFLRIARVAAHASIVLPLLLTGCSGTTTPAAVTPPVVSNPTTATTPGGIQPASTVVTGSSGYFPDPLPIHFKAGVTSNPQTFSGSNRTLLTCSSTTIQPNCFSTSSYTISMGTFPTQAAASGATITSIGNNNIYQDNAGSWQMATTLHLSNPSLSGDTTWSAIAHASPTNAATPVPTAWTIDTLLIGSLSQSVKANYDGKFFEDGGNLYLLYSKMLEPSPLHDGVVAQLMTSATQVAAATAPVTLLEPDDPNNGFNSELYFGFNQSTPFKLVETGNVTKIGSKYVMGYSTGAFNMQGYKTGLAWSDTFLPAATGTYYKKILLADTAGVWGQANHAEVRYLLQADIASWPNYVGSQVLAPGVPSIVLDNSGSYFLYFAGYAPGDAPTVSAGVYDPSHRRPYFLRLSLNIPAATVASTANTDLATWITAATQ